MRAVSPLTMPTNTVSALLAADISDPTDFPLPGIAPGLRQLDSAFRCAICSELLNGPVTLTCGHCFCSTCIRIYVSEKAECPNCRKGATESHVRVNPAMEEAVLAWKAARPFVLHLIQTEAAQRQGSQKTKKKRKRSVPSGSSSDGIECVAGPSSPSKPTAGKKTKTTCTDEKSSDNFTTNRDVTDQEDNRLVACPMCSRNVPFKTINAHMDSGCAPSPGEVKGNQKNAWSMILGPTKGKERDEYADDTEPLPKASYAVFKDKQLKEQLAAYGLWTTGDRNAWIARHQRWVILHNANLDRTAAQRSTPAELRMELRKWEEELRQGRRNGQVSVKEGEYGAYQKANKAQFNELIEAARPKKTDEQSGKERPASSELEPPRDGGEVIMVDSGEEG